MEYIKEDEDSGIIAECLLMRKHSNSSESYIMEISGGFLYTMEETYKRDVNGNTLLLIYPKGHRPQLPYPQNKKEIK